MTSVQEKIQDASARNSELLAGLHETDSAPSQLYQQINYIQDLDTQIKKTEKSVSDLKKQTESELKDHKKYSESTFRRFAHKASGQKEKFADKAAKEEREYFDAIQAQKTAEDDLAYARQLRAEAETSKHQYEIAAQRHDAFQRDLDALYDSIFAGQTPGFPEEDAKENAVMNASQHCGAINQTLEREKHLIFLLNQTTNKLNEARKHLADAHDMSTMDMWGGGAMVSMSKRNKLERAESSISQVRMLQDQIRQIQPNIDLGPMNIASGSIWGDVVFDSIFSDMEMHDKIKNSEAQLLNASNALANQIHQAEARQHAVQADLQQASEMLQGKRKELQRAREDAFARVKNGERISETANSRPQIPQDAPPAYSA